MISKFGKLKSSMSVHLVYVVSISRSIRVKITAEKHDKYIPFLFTDSNVSL